MMQQVYYIQVNLICMILLGIVYSRMNKEHSMVSASQIALRRIILSTAMLCLTDIVAGVCRGRFFSGARLLIVVSNLLYLEMIPVISMLWLVYVLNRFGQNVRKKFILALPLLLFSLVALLNPLTGILFTINDQNFYMRGPGVLLHWIVSWLYLFAACSLAYAKYRATTSWVQRNEIRPLLSFLIFPMIGCLAQMAFYGVTTVQVGITLSIVLISIQMLDNRISVDELTGINNRKAMRRYIEDVIHRHITPRLTVMMLDINKFKHINDTLGHSVGDEALIDAARLLSEACGRAPGRFFLCRYGGDEFVIIGLNISDEAAEDLAFAIRRSARDFEARGNKPYSLELSIGCASGVCESYDDFEKRLSAADDVMYLDKKKIKAV